MCCSAKWAGTEVIIKNAAFGDGMRFSFWLGGSDAAGCCRFARAASPHIFDSAFRNRHNAILMAMATRPSPMRRPSREWKR